MEQNNYVIYGEEYEFEDVILCAFRYAIRRHTYVVEEITSWIKYNAHILNKRMVDVMERDLNERLEEYEDLVAINAITDIDKETLIGFKHWLEDFKKGYDWWDE